MRRVSNYHYKRNDIEMAFRWRADVGHTLNAGLLLCTFSGDLDQNCYETLSHDFGDFSGEGVRTPCPPPPPSGSSHIMRWFFRLPSKNLITWVLDLPSSSPGIPPSVVVFGTQDGKTSLHCPVSRHFSTLDPFSL